MTQMELADLMGVSFQAVSNWERGNSLPDISKIPELCQILDISYDELLNSDSSTANTIKKIIKNESISVEELPHVAPYVEPKKMEEIVDDTLIKNHDEKSNNDSDENKKKINIDMLMGMAPFLDSDYLDQLVNELYDLNLKSDRKKLCGLAPFLRQDTLGRIVKKYFTGNIREIYSIAPFLDENDLFEFVKDCGSSRHIVGLAPFLSTKHVDYFCKSFDNIKDICSLAPFMSIGTLNKIVRRFDNIKDIVKLAPFLSKSTLESIFTEHIKNGDLKDIQALYPFLDLKKIITNIDKGNINMDGDASGDENDDNEEDEFEIIDDEDEEENDEVDDENDEDEEDDEDYDDDDDEDSV